MLVSLGSGGIGGIKRRLNALETAPGGTSALPILGGTGLVGDGVTDDTAALQALIDAAVSGSKQLLLPAGTFRITAELVCSSLGVEISGVGVNKTILRQDTWGLGFVQIRNDRCSVRDIGFLNTQTAATLSGSNYESEPARDRAAGIYIANADYATVEDCHFEGLYCGVRLRGETAADANKSRGNVVHRCTSNNTDMTVLVQQQEDCILAGIQANNIRWSQTGAPPHAIYHTGEFAGKRSKNVTIVHCQVRNALDASAYKFKFIDNLVASDLTCDLVERGIDIQGCTQSKVSNSSITGIFKYTTNSFTGGAATDGNQAGMTILDCTFCQFDNISVFINSGVDDVPGFSLRSNDGAQPGNGTYDCRLTNCYVRAGYTVSNTYAAFRCEAYAVAAATGVAINDGRCEFVNCRFDTVGDATQYGFEIVQGKDHVVTLPVLFGTTRGVKVGVSATNTKCTFWKELFLSGISSSFISNGGSSTRITILPGGATLTLAQNSATPAVSCSLFCKTNCTIATEITNLTGGFEGQEITIVPNSADTAAVTINNAGSFKLKTASWSSGTGGSGRALKLINVGGNWWEC